jgi:hypothetical protein
MRKLAAVHQGHHDVYQEQVNFTRPISTDADGFEWVHGVQDGIPQGLKGGSHPWFDSRVIVHQQDRDDARVAELRAR